MVLLAFFVVFTTLPLALFLVVEPLAVVLKAFFEEVFLRRSVVCVVFAFFVVDRFCV